MSPLPRSFSAPPISSIVLESTLLDTIKLILVGIFDLISPVITSVLGLCVATIRCIPAARASCVILIMLSSTSLLATIIKSANSSIITKINGSFSNSGFLDLFFSTYSL